MTVGARGMAVAVAVAVAAVVAVAAGPAAAAEYDIRASDNAVWVTSGGSYMDYAETASGGGTLDSEKGWMQSWAAGASFLTIDDGKAPLRNLYARLEGSVTTGTTAYSGHYWNGTPATTTTDATVWTVAGRVGRAFAVTPTVMLIPYGELGFRSWDRDITGTGGYDETYRNGDFAGGLMAQYSPVPKVVLTADGGAGYTFLAHMHAGAPLSADYDLGGQPTWHVGGQAGYAFAKQWEAISTVNYAAMAFGASSAVPTSLGSTYEPNSTTDETTVRVGVAWHFY